MTIKYFLDATTRKEIENLRNTETRWIGVKVAFLDIENSKIHPCFEASVFKILDTFIFTDKC